MKDLKEMFDALLDGETLIQDGGKELKKDEHGKLHGLQSLAKLIPANWSIKQKPKQWYENINGRHVLCKVWDKNYGNKRNRIIKAYNNNDHSYHPFIDDREIAWKNAIPLPSKEIQTLLDNAIDIEKDVF